MKRMSALVLGLSGILLAAPAFAQRDLVINLMAPPFDVPPPPQVSSDGQALAALHRLGLQDVRRLGRVGDYWESEGRLRGKPTLAFVYQNGPVTLQPASAASLHQVLNVLPPTAG